MTQVKILTKFEGAKEEYFGDATGGISFTFYKFVSQDSKYEIFIMSSDPEHSLIEEINKSSVISIIKDEEYYRDNYCWEISFTDSNDLLKKDGKGGFKEKTKRFFFGGQPPQHIANSIKVVNKFYESKLGELKKLNNLIPGEISKWESFIRSFRNKLGQLTNEDTSKYQEGKKFIDELETELNKKTGKKNNNDNNSRERERERERQKNWETTETNCQTRSNC